jgi:3-ketosteroid 9alpha-monooxygenase subunit B
MDAVTGSVSALGVPGDRVRHENFLSLASDPFAEQSVALDDAPGSDGPAGTIEIRLDGETAVLAWPANNKMLDVLLGAGLDAPFSCREGRCSACACVVIEGEVEMEHNEVLEKEDIADGIVLACQALPRSERVRVTYDQ